MSEIKNTKCLLFKTHDRHSAENRLGNVKNDDEKIRFLTESLYELVESGRALNRLCCRVEKEFNELFLSTSKKNIEKPH